VGREKFERAGASLSGEPFNGTRRRYTLTNFGSGACVLDSARTVNLHGRIQHAMYTLADSHSHGLQFAR
jgi:hypothetical protein